MRPNDPGRPPFHEAGKQTQKPPPGRSLRIRLTGFAGENYVESRNQFSAVWNNRAPPATRSSPWREAERIGHGGDVRGQIDHIRKEQNADGRVGQPRRIVNPDIARQPGPR
jgi:hypothetical protein